LFLIIKVVGAYIADGIIGVWKPNIPGCFSRRWSTCYG